MTTKIMTVFIACLFISYSKPSYPNITVHVKIMDKQTNKLIEGAECSLDITYETKKCLPYPVEPFEEYSNRNTFKTRNFEITYSLHNPPKKYVFEVKHKDYKTVIQRDSFDKCQFSLNFDIALERKQ